MGQLICVTLLGFLMTSEEGCTDRPTVSHPRSTNSLTTFNLHLKIWYRTSAAQPTAEDSEQLTKGRLQTRHVASVATGISIHMKRERRNVFPRRTLAQRFQKMSHKRIRHTHTGACQCFNAYFKVQEVPCCTETFVYIFCSVLDSPSHCVAYIVFCSEYSR